MQSSHSQNRLTLMVYFYILPPHATFRTIQQSRSCSPARMWLRAVA